jgi:hypothetical protein
MENIGMLYDHLVYFTAIRNILRPFGIFVVIWYIFPRFGILDQEKSGNPAWQKQHGVSNCKYKDRVIFSNQASIVMKCKGVYLLALTQFVYLCRYSDAWQSTHALIFQAMHFANFKSVLVLGCLIWHEPIFRGKFRRIFSPKNVWGNMSSFQA